MARLDRYWPGGHPSLDASFLDERYDLGPDPVLDAFMEFVAAIRNRDVRMGAPAPQGRLDRSVSTTDYQQSPPEESMRITERVVYVRQRLARHSERPRTVRAAAGEHDLVGMHPVLDS